MQNKSSDGNYRMHCDWHALCIWQDAEHIVPITRGQQLGDFNTTKTLDPGSKGGIKLVSILGKLQGEDITQGVIWDAVPHYAHVALFSLALL